MRQRRLQSPVLKEEYHHSSRQMGDGSDTSPSTAGCAKCRQQRIHHQRMRRELLRFHERLCLRFRYRQCAAARKRRGRRMVFADRTPSLHESRRRTVREEVRRAQSRASARRRARSNRQQYVVGPDGRFVMIREGAAAGANAVHVENWFTELLAKVSPGD